LPPDFNNTQELPDKDIVDVLATKAPKEHKALMIEQGFNPETSTFEQFVEVSKRAETKKTVCKERKRCFHSKDISSSEDERPNKKQKPTKARNSRSGQDRKEFCCKEHAPNSTHNSSDFKVIHGRSSDKQAWKNKDKPEKCSDHKSKHKNKARELHVLQSEAKEAKVKWTKAHKKLEAKNKSSSSESEGEHSESKVSKRQSAKTNKNSSN
jgi:hypothetical protein